MLFSFKGITMIGITYYICKFYIYKSCLMLREQQKFNSCEQCNILMMYLKTINSCK